jgi:DNA-binding IclR family transcriptional regulator
VELGKKGLSRISLRAIAKKHLEALVDRVDETAFLGILKDNAVFILDVVECGKELKITAPAGTKLPLSAGATGKLFLAHMEPKNAHTYLTAKGLVPYTPNSITDPDEYRAEIKRVKQNGVAVDREEYMQGVRAVAALVKTEGHPLVAIWIVGFSSSLTDDKLQHISQSTRESAQAISQDLVRVTEELKK